MQTYKSMYGNISNLYEAIEIYHWLCHLNNVNISWYSFSAYSSAQNILVFSWI